MHARAIALLCCGLLSAGNSLWAAAVAAASKSMPQLEAARVALRTHQPSKAAKLLQATAEAGDPEAQYLLGLLYLNGLGVAIDAEPRRSAGAPGAAQQNHPAAAFRARRGAAAEPSRGGGSERAATMAAALDRASVASAPSRPLRMLDR